ncbi:MAG: protein-L-isoaspartate(D-aspartate) O-methyltransferase [Bacteroidetes bacterium]|nr:MAG: protein-L-isoaspartate(D-aspartate) O-methyltransferase [Bacteroidota bacterium]
MIDSYKHQGLRKQLVEIIREKGITDSNVLAAIGKVPRHFFFDSSFLKYAYEDKAFPIGAGQTISQPYTVAFQSQLLMLTRGQKVLEVGTGSGYQACILAEIGAKVFSIERQKSLYDKAAQFLPSLGYRIKLFFGDGYKGLPAYAPFDKIIVTAGAPFIPDALIDQLKPGGILVIPVGGDDVQEMTTITRISEKEFQKREHGKFRFVPLLKDKAREK